MFKRQLRMTVAEIQARVLNHPVLAPLMSDDISTDDYLRALSALHGFYAPMESLLANAPDLKFRSSRAAIIAADIRKMAGDDADRYLGAHAENIPSWTGGDRVIGACCILDQAIFAGRPIVASLGSRFALTPKDGIGFFGASGFDAMAEWRQLTTVVERRADDELAQLRMIDGAMATLAALERWLDIFQNGEERVAA